MEFQILQSELKNSIMATRGGQKKFGVGGWTVACVRNLRETERVSGGRETERVSGGRMRWWMLGYQHGHHQRSRVW